MCGRGIRDNRSGRSCRRGAQLVLLNAGECSAPGGDVAVLGSDNGIMEPTDALRSIETALRLAIREVFGYEWIGAKGAPDEEKLRERGVEEEKRRDGAVVSRDLLDYTETYHLTGIISDNWEKFQPVFKDKGRTLAYFGVIEDVRNSVAHSRDLVPFERDLISGIAGQLRNQVALFRSSEDQSARYYPKIERIVDGFGIEGIPDGYGFDTPPTGRGRNDLNFQRRRLQCERLSRKMASRLHKTHGMDDRYGSAPEFRRGCRG